MKKVAIVTLGCKVNQFESAAFRTDFEQHDCRMVSEKEEANIIVINSCTVTGKAAAQSRQAVRRASRLHPDAKIVVTGCYAQMAAQEVLELTDNPVCIVGNGNKHLLTQAALSETACDLTMLMGKISQKKEICKLKVGRFGERTRAFLRVQDGCSNFCTYCIVPYTRGPSRSLPCAEVIEQAETFARENHREIVVTGIHVGQYGRDLAENLTIVTMMKQLCRATPDVRYRLSSIEPLEITSDLLTLMQEEPNFMPHLHIPLQSGDDTILAKMNRRYTRTQFLDTVKRCQLALPDAALGIDVLVGFPGETDDHFANTLKILQDIDCTYLHVFPYSKRPGTVAETFDNQVDDQVKQKRIKIIRELGDTKKQTFYQANIGQSRPVLVEQKRDKQGLLKGFTDNYIPVSFSGDDEIMNTVTQVRIISADIHGATGEQTGMSNAG